MAGISKALSIEMVEQAGAYLKKIRRGSDVGRKLQAIISAKKYGIKKVSEAYGVSRNTLSRWIKRFAGGVDNLKVRAGRGRRSILSGEERDEIKSWLLAESGITIKTIRIRIEERFGKKVSKTCVHKLIRRLSFSYITPRPQHYRQAEGTQEEFKKNWLMN